MSGLDWRRRAACLGVDSELFFPLAGSHTLAGRDQVDAAKAICAVCPVREQCLAWAIDVLPYGVAGGLSEDERAVLRRRTRRLSWRRPDGEVDVAEAGRQALRDGMSIRDVAAKFGVSRYTVERWADAARVEAGAR